MGRAGWTPASRPCQPPCQLPRQLPRRARLPHRVGVAVGCAAIGACGAANIVTTRRLFRVVVVLYSNEWFIVALMSLYIFTMTIIFHVIFHAVPNAIYLIL